MEVNWVLWGKKGFSDPSIMNNCNLVPTSVQTGLKGSIPCSSPRHEKNRGWDEWFLFEVRRCSGKQRWRLRFTSSTRKLKQLHHNMLCKPEPPRKKMEYLYMSIALKRVQVILKRKWNLQATAQETMHLIYWLHATHTRTNSMPHPLPVVPW